jgi:hypothetical protein
MKNKIPDTCKGCKGLWTGGVKDGKHDKWCCRYGKASYDAIGHCSSIGGRIPIDAPR